MLNNIELVGKNVYNELNEIKFNMDKIFTDEEVQEIVADTDFSKNDSETFIPTKTMTERFKSYFLDMEYIKSLIIYDANGGSYVYQNKILYDIDDDKNNLWYGDTQKMEGRVNWIGTRKITDEYMNDHYTFAVARVLKDIKNYRALFEIGVIYLSFDEKIFGDVYNGLYENEKSSIFIIDKNKKVISHNNRELINHDLSKEKYILNMTDKNKGTFQYKIDGVNSIVYYYDIPEYGWKIVQVMPYASVTGQIKYIAIITVSLCIICMVLLNGVSLGISKKISKPLHDLNLAMGEVEKGNFGISLSNIPNDEIGQIQRRFNIMVLNLKGFFEKATYMEGERKKSELQALYYQMNPHFLYNTLGSVRVMAILSKANNITDMIDALIKLIRSILRKTGLMVTVSEEIDNVKNYLFIQKARYCDKLEVVYKFDEDILPLRVPNFILQPMVENSIFHGIGPKGGFGRISIQGFCKDKNLVFVIEDNGIGMTEDQILNVFNKEVNNDSFLHIGLKNTQDRINMNFGEAYGITIKSSIGEGTSVVIKLPEIREDEV